MLLGSNPLCVLAFGESARVRLSPLHIGPDIQKALTTLSDGQSILMEAAGVEPTYSAAVDPPMRPAVVDWLVSCEVHVCAGCVRLARRTGVDRPPSDHGPSDGRRSAGVQALQP